MLSICERLAWLKSVEIFVGTTDDVLTSLAAMLEEITVSAGATIIQEGEVGDCMYIIVEGELHALSSGKHVASFDVGEIVGEMAVLDLEPRSASVIAVTDTRLFRLGKGSFEQAMNERPEIARGVIRMLVHRLRIREIRLESELQQLRIEIDQIRQKKQIAEITESDFFADLECKAKEIRTRRRPKKPLAASY